MRKNQTEHSIPFWVVELITLGLLVISLLACASAPIDKAKLQADKDSAPAIASAEQYQQLQRLMLQQSSPVQTATAPSLAAAQPPAGGQTIQPLMTPEEYRRQEIEQREKVYADEWRILEHDVTKRVLQRGLQNLDAPTQSAPLFAGQSRCREWKLKDRHWEKRWYPRYGTWQTVLVERWGWVGFPCSY